MAADKLTRAGMAAIALLAWFGLGLQFVLMVGYGRADGRTLFLTLLQFLSFFTLLSNLLVAIVLTVSLCIPQTTLGRIVDRAPVYAATAVYIGIVGIGYSLLLRHIWDPQGWQKVVDILLHDAVPLLYVLWWVFLSAKTRLRWSNVFIWLIWPLVYLISVLMRGALTGIYPYPFIDAGVIGYGRVLISAVGFSVAFALLGTIAVAFTRRRRPVGPA